MTITNAQIDAIDEFRIFLERTPSYMHMIVAYVDEPESRIKDISHICAEIELLLAKVAACADADMPCNCLSEWRDFMGIVSDAHADYFGSVEQAQEEYRSIENEERYERRAAR